MLMDNSRDHHDNTNNIPENVSLEFSANKKEKYLFIRINVYISARNHRHVNINKNKKYTVCPR